MFCKQCGKEIDNDSTFCSYCGYNLENTLPHAPHQTPHYLDAILKEEPAYIESHMIGAILSLFWFFPFAIIAIFYAKQVVNFVEHKDIKSAKIASSKAADWINYSLYAGIAILIFCILFLFIPRFVLK